MKRAKADLREFQTWLTTERGVSTRSSSVYTTHIRSVLAACGPAPTLDQLDKYLGDLEYNMASAVMTGWRKYTEWVHLQTNKVLPEFTRTRRPRGRAPLKPVTAADLPVDVAAALYFCVRQCRLRLVDIEQIQWGGVLQSRTPERMFIRIRPGDKEAHTVPTACMDVFRAYANPSNLLSPLIPVASGSLFPLSAKKLQAALSDYEKKRRSAEQSGKSLPGFDPFAVCEDFVYGPGAKSAGGAISPSSTSGKAQVGDNVSTAVGANTGPTGSTSTGTTGSAGSASSTTTPIRALPEDPKLDVPLSQAITTADLLARLGLGGGGPVPRVVAPNKVLLDMDFGEFEKRTSDYPGDWRYLYDLEEEGDR